MQMLTTCLSPAVYKMVCQLGFEIQDHIEILNILDEDNQVCWDAICSKVCHASSEKGLAYAESVRQLGPLCEAVHSYFMSLPNEKFEETFREHFHWTNNKELFLSVPAVLKIMDGTKISLLLMKMTSCLERALGDVYLTVGKDCPFLLRDLLASEELATIFSKSIMDVLRVFLGSPESLNLRNILWHGFASPHEIPPKYCSVLLLFTAGLGQILQAHHSNSLTSLVHRPNFVFHSAEGLQVFPDLDDGILSFSEKLVEESQFVLANMVPYWKEAITAFRQVRYADCAILILIQLETGLRLIFTTVNNCPDRLLTAESNILYTTFDEILAKHLNDASDNQVPNSLGEPAMEFLWDVLNHQEGPRVRDHLSHGEIQLSEFPRRIANDLLAFSIVLLYNHFNHNDTDKEVAILCPLLDAVGSYQSRFHPIALLQKQVLQCMESVQKWCLLPSPTLSHVSSTEGPEEMTDLGISFSAEIVHVLSLLQNQSGFCNEDLDLQKDKWFISMKARCSKHISNLYCHRWIMEVVNILRRVTAQCQLVSTNIITTSNLRYEQWENKTLRSRQRQNYIRMLSSIKTLSLIIRLILTLIIVDFSNILSIPMKTLAEYQKYLKYLKSILQYAENVVTYTSQDQNRWDGAMQLTHRIVLKIRIFLESSNWSTDEKVDVVS
ncbi:PREDICTED: endoplasmic reticulum membrane-associated RNA degradation protein [Nanorana parkeri]|uniref:endoplasmic reticulum membrane-associated RNA degradation protein n=1 Tax=Nanorana parkeri TaxID=125878 RepID=UPI000854325B|nr:PREDICTED: endoplasmic reticulum membrane-associated RNA degradation protein [Nanorana parkeri]